jgi:hypothetical protein
MDKWELEPDDVLEMDNGFPFRNQTVFKVEQVKQFLANTLNESHRYSQPTDNPWVASGASCKLLSPKAIGWRKGRVKITVEFIWEDQNGN